MFFRPFCKDEDATEKHVERKKRRISYYSRHYRLNILNLTSTPAKWIVNDELINFVSRNG